MKKDSLLDAVRNKRNKTINIKIELEPADGESEMSDEPVMAEKDADEKQEEVGLAPEVKDRKASEMEMSPEEMGLVSEDDMMAAEAMEKDGKEPRTIEERIAYEQMMKRKAKGK